MTHNDLPKDMICDKKQCFKQMYNLGDILLGWDISFYAQLCPKSCVSCCACEPLQLWCLREAGCLLPFPWVWSLEKTQTGQLKACLEGSKTVLLLPLCCSSQGVQAMHSYEHQKCSSATSWHQLPRAACLHLIPAGQGLHSMSRLSDPSQTFPLKYFFLK